MKVEGRRGNLIMTMICIYNVESLKWYHIVQVCMDNCILYKLWMPNGLVFHCYKEKLKTTILLGYPLLPDCWWHMLKVAWSTVAYEIPYLLSVHLNMLSDKLVCDNFSPVIHPVIQSSNCIIYVNWLRGYGNETEDYAWKITCIFLISSNCLSAVTGLHHLKFFVESVLLSLHLFVKISHISCTLVPGEIVVGSVRWKWFLVCNMN